MAKVGSHDGDHDVTAQTELFRYLRANAGIEIAPGIEKRRDTLPPPLSFAQERLWFLDQLQPGGAAHNICKAHRLFGSFDAAALSRALRGVIGRHEVLRTSFRRDDGPPVQVISESTTPTIGALDVSSLDELSADAEVARLVSEEARRPFDLASGPLLRMTLIKRGATDHVLVLTVHQMVFDGWSIGVLFRDLASMYDAEISGRSVKLPGLPVQYADYVQWQRQRLQGDALQAQLTYWKRRLGEVLPICSLPTTYSRPLVQFHRGTRLPLSIGETTLKGLLEVAQRARATLFETLMAAFNVLLHRYSGQSDIVVGFPVANRERTEMHDLIGFFVNTLALRTELSDDLTFAELLLCVRDACRDAMKHRELPFEKLVEELRLERDLGRNPIFQVMFAYQNEAPPILRLTGLRSDPMETDTGAAKFDLTLSL
ncbi:MAG TPA: condensation domain-containing protein, partial [Candidatus Binatia bacterium]|nr:condensation domain-containing protein [Candidatus Binatia bacterium]